MGIVPIIIGVSCGGCGVNSRSEDLRHMLGQEVIIPTMRCRWQGEDTVVNERSCVLATIVAYYDEKGCTPCKLKELVVWKSMLREIESEVGQKLRFDLIVQSGPRFRSLEVDLEAYKFPYSIYFDTQDDFERRNPNLPEDPLFHVFLLDRDNRVVLVGSPVGNPKMWELYKSTIARLGEGEGIMPGEKPER